MLSVIIPTEGIEQPAVATLAALVPGAAAGVIREVLLVDRAGNGVIERVADVAGCRFLKFEGTRAAALAAGARQARSPWLMFLHAGAVLDSGWIEETSQFINGVANSGRPRAAVFRYARSPYAERRLRDGLKAIARMVVGPSAEQGLLIAREHYDRLGGYRPDARRSEARLLRQLGRSSRTLLRSRIMVVA
ncbi:glycosyl transferase [Bradyrhizobium sp.]|uniref:glycosyl transferase n=1 Tax=Bradyrhizobium sp. TaxID=376 RepID=UPI00403761EA